MSQIMHKRVIRWSILCACITTWLTSKSACHILRTPCQDYGNFSVNKTGFMLTGHNLATLEGLTVQECEKECVHRQACKSINTKPLKCELVSKSTENPFDNVNLTAKAEWTYRTTDYSEQNIGHLCQKTKPCPMGMSCIDTCSCPGYKCEFKTMWGFRDCKDGYDRGFTTNQVYAFKLAGTSAIAAPCDMTTDGGGWTVFQRRVDNSVDFDRNWKDYKEGFGDLNGNFWLGLDKLHALAAPGKGAVLRVELKHMDYGSKVFYEKYSTFKVENEANGYKLTVGGASGNATDSLTHHNGMKFSTRDKDQDFDTGHGSKNCANTYKGGWWYRACHHVNLNGLYPTKSDHLHPQYMSWRYLKNNYGKITFSEMKVKISINDFTGG